MARRRRRYQRPRCRNETCHAPVVFFRGAHTGTKRPFDPKPFDRAGGQQRVAYPVENRTTWWLPRDLVEDLAVRHGISPSAAASEVDDMDWYTPHVCPSGPALTERLTHDLEEVAV